MLTKTKIALAMAIVAATSSVALADFDFDPNPANRYPSYAAPGVVQSTFRSAPVRLQSRPAALPTRPGVSLPTTHFEMNQFDRASSPDLGMGGR
jgi:hypothetical protein